MKLYTYAESPVRGLVRKPRDPFMAAGYVAGLPGVGRVVHERALAGAEAARLVLYHHVSEEEQGRSHFPRIAVEKGDRTDWHINMYVSVTDKETDEDALAAAWSIEYGRFGYRDRLGRQQPATQGIGALTTALAVMWGGGA